MIPCPDGLRSEMARNGLTPPALLEPQRFHRFPGADKDRSNKAGWLKLFADDSAVFGDMSRNLSRSWHSRRDTPLTRAEVDARERGATQQRAEADRRRRAAEQDTASRAQKLWLGAAPAITTHPYLAAKGIQPHGLRQIGDSLMVPMFDPADGSLVNVQWIRPNGDKRFMSSGRKHGTYCPLEDSSSLRFEILLLAEGFATAASLVEATKHPTFCGFDAGNLLPVAESLRKKFPKARIVICGDNDANGTGQSAAFAAARAIDGHVAIPLTQGRDWNDVYTADGLDAVRSGIESARIPDSELGQDANASNVDSSHLIAEAKRTDPIPWPNPLVHEAYHGIIGEFVELIAPQTEADSAAILLQALVAFGATVGRGPHVKVEGDEHHAALYAVIVGESSKARKGTSWGRVRQIFSATNFWPRVVEGLSSGEGLKYNVRDAREEEQYDKKRKISDVVVVDKGVEDKRLLVIESEFAQALRQTARNGNTLSATVRSAWDTGCLMTLTKNDPVVATGAHICIIGHITIPELHAELTATDTANGFANRFLFGLARRSQLLPFGGDPLAPDVLAQMTTRLNRAIANARTLHSVHMTDDAKTIWEATYAELSQSRPGLQGAVTARSEAQALRLALVYAMADCSAEINKQHLLAALAVIQYVQASAEYIFGDALGDPVADELLKALRKAGDVGLTRTNFQQQFHRHLRTERLNSALDLLVSRGLACRIMEATGGRPSEVWRAATKAKKAKKGDP